MNITTTYVTIENEEMSEHKTEQDVGPKVRKKAVPEVVAVQEHAGLEHPQEVQQALSQEPQVPDIVVPIRRVVDPNAGTSSAPSAQAVLSEHEIVQAAVPEAQDISTDDFAAMFDQGGQAAPKRQRFDLGDQVEGVVAHVDAKFVFVDLGGRGEARASREQYTTEEGELELVEGQQHKFFIIGINREGILLGKHLEARDAGLDAIEAARDGNLPVQGKVLSRNKGGFEVELLGVKAFCPVSQIDVGRVEDLDVYLNQTLNFRVLEVRQGGRSIVVSRAIIQREESEARREETLKALAKDSVLDGVVRSLSDYGAFVDLGGIDGLVHVSEMSWSNLNKPSDLVRVGQSVTVKVLSIEAREGKSPRISLSMKQVEGDPWEKVNELFHAGQEVTGQVVRVANFGAFVELSQGIDGLVHVSEMSWKHVSRPGDVVSVNDTVTVEILDIDLLRRRISLSMKSVESDPWSTVTERFAPAMEIEGKVEKVEDFGVFVALSDGITALLPRSEMNLDRGTQPHSVFRKGQDVKARVFSVDTERRRIALTLREDVDPAQAQASNTQRTDRNKGRSGGKGRDRRQGSGGAPRSYQDTSNGSFGSTFGDLLKKKNT